MNYETTYDQLARKKRQKFQSHPKFPDFEKEFKFISNIVMNACTQWEMVEFLFRDKKNRDTLYESTYDFFNTLLIILLDISTLHITNLTAPNSKYQENLTLKTLVASMTEIGCVDVEVIDDLNSILKNLKAIRAPFKKWRHKIIAHLSYKEALKIKELPDIKFDAFLEALTLISEFLNIINGWVYDSETMYLDSSWNPADDIFSAVVGANAFEKMWKQMKIDPKGQIFKSNQELYRHYCEVKSEFHHKVGESRDRK
jgi:hypothetical protein